MVPDPDIHPAARQWVSRHGELATAKTREMVEEYRPMVTPRLRHV
jgi:hypothetical protein